VRVECVGVSPTCSVVQCIQDETLPQPSCTALSPDSGIAVAIEVLSRAESVAAQGQTLIILTHSKLFQEARDGTVAQTKLYKV